MISRRKILQSAPALIGLTAKAERRITGSFVNDGFPLGHKLRDRVPFRAAARQERYPVVIVGGGMAGLNAAWRLQKRGLRDFVLLEMEPEAGGNSRSGQNSISRYPWAAHYVPVPDAGEILVRELFEELGVLRDGIWNERTLCFSPQERLFLHGRWQEGIEPEVAATDRDRENYQRFERRIQEFRATGEFTIPSERATPRKTLPLDALSFTDWASQNGFTSPYLRWYLDYACRDDYGASSADTSAWAGIHYFASRSPTEKGPLTWPDGNGWIARQLLDRLQSHVRTGSPVYAIERQGTRVRVRTEAVDYTADRVIFAAPTFLAPYLIDGMAAPRDFVYSPWLTANLTLDRLPREKTLEPAWDNVIYDSPALGYVIATHMSLRSRIDQTVWTYYWSLTDRAPAEARQLLLDKDWGYWRDAILNDLSRAHPDIRECVSHIDIMRIGHAMARPVPGFRNSESRHRFASAGPPIYFANSDLAGFSIFEEAQHYGVTAADRALRDIGKA